MRLIDADELIYGLKTEFGQFAMTYILAFIKAQPTVDPVKHGHWITVSPNYSEPDDWYCECSLCGCAETDTTQFLPNYCSNCGAKMDGYKPLDGTEDD